MGRPGRAFPVTSCVMMDNKQLRGGEITHEPRCLQKLESQPSFRTASINGAPMCPSELTNLRGGLMSETGVKMLNDGEDKYCSFVHLSVPICDSRSETQQYGTADTLNLTGVERRGNLKSVSSKDKSGQKDMQAWNTYWFGEGKRRRVKGSVLHGRPNQIPTTPIL